MYRRRDELIKEEEGAYFEKAALAGALHLSIAVGIRREIHFYN